MVRRRLNLRVVLYGVRELGERAGYLLAAARQISDTLVVAGRHGVYGGAVPWGRARDPGAGFSREPDDAGRAWIPPRT